jgi:hypothetical protein
MHLFENDAQETERDEAILRRAESALQILRCFTRFHCSWAYDVCERECATMHSWGAIVNYFWLHGAYTWIIAEDFCVSKDHAMFFFKFEFIFRYTLL